MPSPSSLIFLQSLSCVSVFPSHPISLSLTDFFNSEISARGAKWKINICSNSHDLNINQYPIFSPRVDASKSDKSCSSNGNLMEGQIFATSNCYLRKGNKLLLEFRFRFRLNFRYNASWRQRRKTLDASHPPWRRHPQQRASDYVVKKIASDATINSKLIVCSLAKSQVFVEGRRSRLDFVCSKCIECLR